MTTINPKLPYWHHQLVLSWYHHQPESHQQSLNQSSWREGVRTPGPIDWTPETPGSGNNQSNSPVCVTHIAKRTLRLGDVEAAPSLLLENINNSLIKLYLHQHLPSPLEWPKENHLLGLHQPRHRTCCPSHGRSCSLSSPGSPPREAVQCCLQRASGAGGGCGMLETRVPAKGRKPAYWDERREVAPAWIGWLWEWPGRGIEGRGLLQPGLGFTHKQLSGIDSARKISILLLPIIVLVSSVFCSRKTSGIGDNGSVLFLLSVLWNDLQKTLVPSWFVPQGFLVGAFQSSETPRNFLKPRNPPDFFFISSVVIISPHCWPQKGCHEILSKSKAHFNCQSCLNRQKGFVRRWIHEVSCPSIFYQHQHGKLIIWDLVSCWNWIKSFGWDFAHGRQHAKFWDVGDTKNFPKHSKLRSAIPLS